MKWGLKASVYASVLAGIGGLLLLSGEGAPLSVALWSSQASAQGQAQSMSIQASSTNLGATANAGVVNQAKAPVITAETPRRLEKPFTRSLEGTEIDGSLRADANGQLIVDLQVKDLFDYFLATVGDVTPEVAVAEIEKLARASLPPDALNQAMALLSQYLSYKEAALELSGQALLPLEQQTPAYQLSVLEQGLANLKTSRREHMSPEAVEAFFAQEEAYGEYTLESIRLQQRTDLTDAQKVSHMEMARARLPEVVRQSEERMQQEQANQLAVQDVVTKANNPAEAESGLRQLGVPDTEITAIVGHLKAQQDFDRQYQDYATAHSRLRASGLAPSDLAREQELLQQRYFRDESSLTQARLRDLTPSSTL